MSKVKKVKQEKHTIDIIFNSGLACVAEYEIDENVDDYIWEDFRKGWEANTLWYPCDWADFELRINEKQIDEIDMRKVVGAKYNI